MSNFYLPRLLKTIKVGNSQKKQKNSNKGHLSRGVGKRDDKGIQ